MLRLVLLLLLCRVDRTTALAWQVKLDDGAKAEALLTANQRKRAETKEEKEFMFLKWLECSQVDEAMKYDQSHEQAAAEADRHQEGTRQPALPRLCLAVARRGVESSEAVRRHRNSKIRW